MIENPAVFAVLIIGIALMVALGMWLTSNDDDDDYRDRYRDRGDDD